MREMKQDVGKASACSLVPGWPLSSGCKETHYGTLGPTTAVLPSPQLTGFQTPPSSRKSSPISEGSPHWCVLEVGTEELPTASLSLLLGAEQPTGAVSAQLEGLPVPQHAPAWLARLWLHPPPSLWLTSKLSSYFLKTNCFISWV